MAGSKWIRCRRFPLLLAAVFVIGTGLAGCSKASVLVISDRYAESLESQSILDRRFLAGLRIRGYRVLEGISSSEYPVSQIISELDAVPDYVILSPFNAPDARLPDLQEARKVVIAGSEAAEDLPPNVIGVAVNYPVLYRDVGRLAAEIAGETSGPPVLFHDGRASIIVEGYSSNEGNRSDLTELTVNNTASDSSLPEGFIEIAAEASVLLLFAGGRNIDALKATEDLNTPVITEHAFLGAPFNERIIASVENDGPRMRRKLIEVIRGENTEQTVYYSGSLEK